MKTNAVKQNVPAPLLRAALMKRLGEDDSPPARDARAWLESEDAATVDRNKGASDFRKQWRIVRSLVEIARVSGSDEAMMRNFAAAAEAEFRAFEEGGFLLAEAALPPMAAAAFAQAAALLSAMYRASVPKFAPRDLVLSQPVLTTAFANGRACAKNIHKALKTQGVPIDDAGIAVYDKPAMLTWHGETFPLKKGRNGPACCWGIAAKDRERFIQAAGLLEQGKILPFDDGDLALSNLVLGANFANGVTCARKIHKALKAQEVPIEPEDIVRYDKPVTLGWNGETFSLKKGRNGPAYCWGIAAKDRERFIQAAGLMELKGEILPFDVDDLVLSQTVLSAAFRKGLTCARKIHEALKAQEVPIEPEDVVRYDKPVTLEWNGETFSLKKGRNVTNYCWGIAAEDRDRFIQAAGLVERSPYTLQRIGPNETPLTPEGVAKAFRGKDGENLTGEEILERIKAAMRPVPRAERSADIPVENAQ